MRRLLFLTLCVVLVWGVQGWGRERPWLGVHILMASADKTEQLTEVIGELADQGINAIVAEINYGYAYQSHPELRGGNPSSAEQIGELVAACRASTTCA